MQMQYIWINRSCLDDKITVLFPIRFTVWKSKWVVLNLLIFKKNYNSVTFCQTPQIWGARKTHRTRIHMYILYTSVCITWSPRNSLTANFKSPTSVAIKNQTSYCMWVRPEPHIFRLLPTQVRCGAFFLAIAIAPNCPFGDFGHGGRELSKIVKGNGVPRTSFSSAQAPFQKRTCCKNKVGTTFKTDTRLRDWSLKLMDEIPPRTCWDDESTVVRMFIVSERFIHILVY